MRDTAGSAAATARCRKFRRGSFILNLPLASLHSITSSARATWGRSCEIRTGIGISPPPQSAFGRLSEQKPPLAHLVLGRNSRGEGSLSEEPVAMHRGFPLILAEGLRACFADIISTPLPERLASLVHLLSAAGDERSGEPNHGASTAETSSRVDRRGRRRTPRPDSGAVRRRTSGDHRVRKRRSSSGDLANRRA